MIKFLLGSVLLLNAGALFCSFIEWGCKGIYIQEKSRFWKEYYLPAMKAAVVIYLILASMVVSVILMVYGIREMIG